MRIISDFCPLHTFTSIRVCVLGEYTLQVKNKQLLLYSTASARLVVVEGTSWFLLSCLLQSFLPKKVCGKSLRGWKGHFYCAQQQLIPDWGTVSRYVLVRTGGKNGGWNKFYCSKAVCS